MSVTSAEGKFLQRHQVVQWPPLKAGGLICAYPSEWSKWSASETGPHPPQSVPLSRAATKLSIFATVASVPPATLFFTCCVHRSIRRHDGIRTKTFRLGGNKQSTCFGFRFHDTISVIIYDFYLPYLTAFSWLCTLHNVECHKLQRTTAYTRRPEIYYENLIHDIQKDTSCAKFL